MTVHLLDGNVLVALADAAHVHHAPASGWFAARSTPFASCPITQDILLRMLLLHRAVSSPPAAAQILTRFTAHPRHRFWPDDRGYADIAWRGVPGHRQVTDAHLAALARHRKGRLVTFDRGLAALHEDIAELVPA